MGMNWLFKPTTDLPSRLGKMASEHYSPPNEVGNRFRGFMSGASEGAGDLVSSMTSPFGIATTLMGMPWARGLGTAGRAMSSLGRLDDIPRGISPSMLPSELVGQSGASIYNAGRNAMPAARTVEDLAYEVVKRGGDPINKQIGGSFNLAEAMRRSNAARGR